MSEKTLQFHYEKFLVSMINNSELMRDVMIWMKSQSDIVETYTKKEVSMLSEYCSEEFRRYWKTFDIFCKNIVAKPPIPNSPSDTELGMQRAHFFFARDNTLSVVGFSKIFQKSTHFIPRGMVLFEGQGRNETDIYKRLQNGTLKVGKKYIRARPTSSTWVPNVAMNFINENIAVDEDFAVHMKHKPLERQELAIKMDRYHNNGCLLVITIQNSIAKGVFRQIMKESLKEECEIIIQPYVEMVVTRVEKNVHIPSTGICRVASLNPLKKCDIVWLDMYGTSMNVIFNGNI